MAGVRVDMELVAGALQMHGRISDELSEKAKIVGTQGVQKYRISCFPTPIFLLSSGSPMALPAASSDAGKPQ